MNTDDFLHMLRDINYPHINKIRASECDWLFELDGDAGEFIRWLCCNVGADKLLGPEERARYNQLRDKQQPLDGSCVKPAASSSDCRHLLEGAALTAALDWQRRQQATSAVRLQDNIGSCQSRSQRLRQLRQQLDDKCALRDRLKRTANVLRQQQETTGVEEARLQRALSAACDLSRRRICQHDTASAKLQQARQQLSPAAEQLIQRLCSADASSQKLPAVQLEKLVSAETVISGLIERLCTLVRSDHNSPQFTALSAKLPRVICRLMDSIRGKLQYESTYEGWRSALRLAESAGTISSNSALNDVTKSGPDCIALSSLSSALHPLCTVSEEQHVRPLVQLLFRKSYCKTQKVLQASENDRRRRLTVAEALVRCQISRCLWLRLVVQFDCERRLAAVTAFEALQQRVRLQLSDTLSRHQGLRHLLRRKAAVTGGNDRLVDGGCDRAVSTVWSCPPALGSLNLALYQLEQLNQLAATLHRSRVPGQLQRALDSFQQLKQQLRQLVETWQQAKDTQRPVRLWVLAVLAPSLLPEVVSKHEQRLTQSNAS